MQKILSFLAICSFVMQACTFHPAANDHKIRAGVFSGNGASAVCVIETMEALKADPGMVPRTVSAREIADGVLKDLDALVFPGGSGSQEANNLGEEGMQRVRKFVVEEGHGVVGICAGAYLLSDTPDYSCLHLSGLQAIDRAHDARGGALACVVLKPEVKNIFPELTGYDSVFIQYNEGPVLIPAHDTIPYTVLALFQTDVHAKPGAPAGMTPGKPYLITAETGKGRAFISVGHPESTPGMRWIVPRMVRWTTRQDLVSYPEQIVRPDRDQHAIVFDPAYRKREKAMFWQLFDVNPEKRKGAIQALHNMRSRSGVRWTMGMLRDTVADIRSLAAAMLADAEYTYAIPDIRQAVAKETDPAAKKDMQKSLDALERIISFSPPK